jgi:putative salt-induced outer membrane protein YdiY
LASATPVQAQQPSPPPPPPPQEGTAEFSFVGTSGNASTEALGLSGEYIVRRAPWEFKGKAAYVRNESEDILNAESFAGLFRVARILTPRVSMFGQYRYLQDEFAGIDSRNAIDGGVTIAVVRPRPHQFDVDLGIGYANEQRLVGDDLSSAQGITTARYKLAVSETAEITDDLGLTFSLSDSDDVRLGNIVALTAKITTIFSLKVSNTVRYVKEPAPGFLNTDTITAVALVAKF